MQTEHPAVNLRVLRNRGWPRARSLRPCWGLALYGGIFILPVFLQNLRHFTAAQTGWILFPGGITTGRRCRSWGVSSRSTPARNLTAVGAFVFVLSMFCPQPDDHRHGQARAVLAARPAGRRDGFLFVPLTLATLVGLRPGQVAEGTGLFNLSRQLGGSAGIAVTATLLTRFTEKGREALLPHLTPYDPAAQHWLGTVTQLMHQRGGTLEEARQRAYALLNFTLQRQASVVAFEKIFLLMGLTFAGALILLVLFRTGRTTGGPVGH